MLHYFGLGEYHHIHRMTSRKSTVFMFFGIIIGLCFGILFKNYRALELVKKCSLRPNTGPLEMINLQQSDTMATSQSNLVFVGVMTAKEFLTDRAKAVYDTWGKEVPGRLAFFSSEGSYSDHIPVIALKGVDDRYPPQKKSFRMLYFMYEHYIDRFEWFARADDDVYINTEKLEKFLRSIDSTKPQFIGQAGRGNSEEFGLLSLEFDENFCMGGPGVIMSRETLRRVAPHIPTCLKNLYSTHEDVEVGRCVQKFAGIPCTWNYEMQSILHHNSSGQNAFTGNLKTKEIHNAITLHPVKRAPLMYRLHSYMQGLRAQQLRQETLSLHRDIAMMKSILLSKSDDNEIDFAMKFEGSDLSIFPSNEPDDVNFLGDHDILSTKPHLNKAKSTTRDELLTWSFIARSLYSGEQLNPKKKLDSSLREGLDDVIIEVMDYINNFSRQRGRVIDFKEILYGYSRLNSLYGQDLVLDLLLIYKKYRGKKMTVPVRRHLYLQRAFTDCFVRELKPDRIYNEQTETTKFGNLTSLLSLKMKNIWKSSVDRISDTLSLNSTFQNGRSKVLPSKKSRTDQTKSTIVFVLPLAGRFQTLQRFLKNYERVCLQHPDTQTELLVVLFDETNSNLKPFYAEMEKLKDKYTTSLINHITIQGNFSRGVALNQATHSEHIQPNDIIFFIDVDITFKRTSIERIRLNTKMHKQVYLPIVFSEYNPAVWSRTQYDGSSEFNDNEPLNLGHNRGYFRQFGYGICAIFKADILHPDINGFNDDITGWGLEDVKFLEKLVKLHQTPVTSFLNGSNTNHGNSTAVPLSLSLSVFRAVDPTLVHIYHDIYCDKSLSESQYGMCVGTKANTLGSYKHIESIFMNNQTIIDYMRSIITVR